MNKVRILKIVFLFNVFVFWSNPLFAFDSGSTGVDGAFSPTENQVIDMNDQPSGVYNYTSINIPLGVTITFIPNAANTPIVMLAQEDVVIAGTINISGEDGKSYGLAVPGPGGYRGGRGGLASNGGNGSGPGGAAGGLASGACGGSGAGYGAAGQKGRGSSCSAQTAGSVYGSVSLIPLFGGSGGAGGSGNSNSRNFGGSGGTGAGAILIASSGTLTLNGSIFAIGGDGMVVNGYGSTGGGSGGSGSGGAVRLLASVLTGNGDIDISGGSRVSNNYSRRGGKGGAGRVRFEADNYNFTGTITPVALSDAVSPALAVFPANIAAISITTIAGRSVPAQPAGSGDVQLPSNVANPVTVELTASNVPLASAIELTVVPVIGDAVTTTSTPLAGTEASSTATATITLPQGVSVITASVSYSITIVMGEAYSPFAEGELVASMRIDASPGQTSMTTLIAVSGKEYTWPSNAIALTN